MSLTTGTKLGPYEITGAIGAGGMGEVYRARDSRLDRIVALKIAKQEFGERADREARAIAQLNHPHICQVYDVGPNYLVMEYVEGAPLKAPLALKEVIEYSGQILDALDAAHRKGITHRDLKPANILVTAKGIKLLDFGLAKLAAAPLQQSDETITRAVTQQGQIVGTLQYMSPEQLQGQDVDARSDLFSFGCLLYEMISGKRAFDGTNAASIIASILEREPAPLDTVPPLDRVVRRCLAKNPDDRFQTARDLKAALNWAVEQLPAPPPAVLQARKASWLPWAVAAVAAICAIAAAAAWFLRSQPADVPSTFAVEPPEGAAFNYAITGSALSPDGHYLVFRAIGQDGIPLLWLRPLDSLSARPLQGTEGADFPFWSADGKVVAFFAGDKLKRLDLVGGAPVSLCDANSENGATGGTWNQAGMILFSDRIGLHLVPGSGGTPTLLAAPDRSRNGIHYAYPQFLPDGKHFIFLLASDDPNLAGAYVASVDQPADRKLLLKTSTKPVFAPPISGHPGYLLFLQGRSLLAQRFDAGELRTEGDPEQVAPDVSVLPALWGASFWVSDTGLLAYHSGLGFDKSKLFWISRDGKSMRDAAPEAAYSALRLSPDGKRLALARSDAANESNVWIVDLQRGAFTRFTFDMGWNTCPVWSPAGAQIAFVEMGPPTTLLYRQDSAGGGREDRLNEGTHSECLLDWSTDGRYLVYGEASNGLASIWALDIPGKGKPVSVVPPPFNTAGAQISPDGHWLAYSSNESERYEVYVKAFPPAEGGPEGKWQISNAGGRAPRWRRDGKELFYVSPDNKITAAEIQLTSRGVEIGSTRALFAIPDLQDFGDRPYPYDVTPDGQQFIVEEPTVQQSYSPLTVVVNWQAALKK